ncbi:hypothetical protein BJY00DRAFT_302816 [Aspergillus carlsbadensis]|nr:hypothetical protein BJY00DRAFT_302816 [Aspergillus carlsbadensis]
MLLVSLLLWLQTHPFTVVLWLRDRQDTIELLLQPRDGLSADLVGYAPAVKENLISFLALFTGPHGIVKDISLYKSILVITSGFGIAAVRRLHLVWEVKSVVKMAMAKALLNNLLEDNIMDNGYILQILIYVRDGLEPNQLPFSKHDRVCLYQGLPDYQNIISLKASGGQIKRLPNVWDKQGRTLVMVSAADGVQDYIQKIVQGHLH